MEEKLKTIIALTIGSLMVGFVVYATARALAEVKAPHPAAVWHREVTCKETEMKNFCYCAGENSCSFTEKCDVAEKAGFDVIYSGKDVFK